MINTARKENKRRLKCFSVGLAACVVASVTFDYLPTAQQQLAHSAYKRVDVLWALAWSKRSYGISPSDASSLLPPLSELIDGEEVIGNVSSLLDFYIVGFPKCGTTALMNYFKRQVDEVLMAPSEVCFYKDRDCKHIADGVRKLHGLGESSTRKVTAPMTIPFKRALKCPDFIYDDECPDCIAKTVDYFPNTNFIVTLRHPVDWFRSFYNFRSYKKYPNFRHDPKDLMNVTCSAKTSWVCTDHSRFHLFLSNFGKTNLTTSRELDLLKGQGGKNKKKNKNKIPNKIFLIEQGQLIDSDEIRSSLLRQDMKIFLGLENDLPPIESDDNFVKFPETERTQFFIDICDDEHAIVRSELVRNGKNAAEWIRDFFLNSPDVVVSSRADFLERLKLWEVDPCQNLTVKNV